MGDDAELAGRCGANDDDAWAELRSRFDRRVQLVTVRVLDERRSHPDILTEAKHAGARVWAMLRRNEGGPLRVWHGSNLGTYLSVLARGEAEAFAMDETPIASPLKHAPRSTSDTRTEEVGEKPANRIAEVLDRLPPQATAMVRLRQRGLSLHHIATTLGQPQLSVSEDLARVAKRLAQAQSATDAELIWRHLLNCEGLSERVRVALRTEEDGVFRRTRTVIEATWKKLRERALVELKPRTPGPLEEPLGVAAFVDGSMKGAERTRAEGHLATCQRCVDVVAMLVLDLRAAQLLRATAELDAHAALAAVCLATGRERAALTLATAAVERDAEYAEPIRRLAAAALGMSNDSDSPDVSQVYAMRPGIPSDDEAHVQAVEALVAGDATAAYRAVDDHAAKHTIGQRLRLLAAASGPDLPEARELAQKIAELASPDPGLRADATCVLALPEHRELPREVLVERLRDAMADAVRFVARS